MSDDRHVVRRIAWREVFPWLMLFRCFRLAVSLPVLFLATLGTLVSPLGELAARRFLSADESPSPVNAVVSVHPSHTVWPRGVADEIASLEGIAWWGNNAVARVYWTFVRPVARLFDPTTSSSAFLYHLITALWLFAVWSLFGGAITRMAVVQLGREERVSMVESLRHTLRHLVWYFTAPLFPLLGITLLSLPLVVLGLLMRLDVGVLVSGIVWPLALIAGFLMGILLVGFLAGWPLMWPTISAEQSSDAFEAFSRSFSYTFQRPLKYLLYASVLVLFGGLCWFFVDYFADGVIALSHWAVSFGAGAERHGEILAAGNNANTSVWLGSRIIGWSDWLIRMIALAFTFSFFFCVSSAIYLLLRREVDQTDFDDVYVPDEANRYGLPPLRTGPTGVPEVNEPADDKPGP